MTSTFVCFLDKTPELTVLTGLSYPKAWELRCGCSFSHSFSVSCAPGYWEGDEKNWGRWETQDLLLLFRCYVASDSFVTSWTVGLPSSSVHEISQARILEWVAISFSRGSSWPRDGTRVSCIFCIGRRILYHWATWEARKLKFKWGKSRGWFPLLVPSWDFVCVGGGVG